MAKNKNRNRQGRDAQGPGAISERYEAAPTPPATERTEPRPAAAARQRAHGRAVLRDQRWALYAYTVVDAVPGGGRKDYKIAVNDLGANILRSGLAAAMTAIERLGKRGGLLLEHLAGAGVDGLEDATRLDLPARVRGLDVDGYMLATREMLQIATWLKRATQATFGED